MQAQDVPATGLDDELQRLAADLIGALRDEPVAPAILALAAELQRALDARKAAYGVVAQSTESD